MRIARKFPGTPLKTRSCLFFRDRSFFLLGSGWVEFEGGGGGGHERNVADQEH